ncbi:MAG TPA: methyltransferase domain-containing protein [Patescibacteria group bacterium]|nr:methyltransferase domain-containing protein [Patescibacteria group bacterium]
MRRFRETTLKQIRFYVSPYFLLRYYLYRDIKVLERKYHFLGSTLDVGCGVKPYQKIFSKISQYQGIDFKDFSVNKDSNLGSPDFFFDETYEKNLILPFPDKSFQNVFSFQVLEHHRAPKKFISELFRVAKKNGLILFSFPFIFGLHEQPNDYQRFTEFGLNEILKENDSFRILEVKKQGSLFSTITTLISVYLNAFASKSKLSYALSILVYPFFLLLQYLSLFLDKVFKSDEVFLNYLFLVKRIK